MKLSIMFARIMWLRFRINQLQAEIDKEQAQIDYWDKQNKALVRRIAELEKAQ